MNFLAPDRLWLMLIPLLGVAGYLWSLRRHEQFAVRFSNFELLDSVMPDRPGWRRHLPAVAALRKLHASGVEQGLHRSDISI